MYLKSFLRSVIIKPAIPYKTYTKKKKKRRKKIRKGMANKMKNRGPGSDPLLKPVVINAPMKTTKKDNVYKIIPIIKTIMPVA